MMMFALNSLVRQKEGAQEEEEQAGGGRKAESTGTPTPGADAPICRNQSGCRMRGTVENMDDDVVLGR